MLKSKSTFTCIQCSQSSRRGLEETRGLGLGIIRIGILTFAHFRPQGCIRGAAGKGFSECLAKSSLGITATSVPMPTVTSRYPDSLAVIAASSVALVASTSSGLRATG